MQTIGTYIYLYKTGGPFKQSKSGNATAADLKNSLKRFLSKQGMACLCNLKLLQRLRKRG